jgi:hypothetical protein
MYTISFWAGLGITGILLLALLLLIAVFVAEGELAMMSWSVVVLLIVVAIALFGFFPYEKEYHAYIDHGGVVERVDKRLLPDGESMQEKFVVTFVGDPVQVGCEDTRCATARPGDTLVLACLKDWDLFGTDGYDCKFRSWTPGS